MLTGCTYSPKLCMSLFVAEPDPEAVDAVQYIWYFSNIYIYKKNQMYLIVQPWQRCAHSWVRTGLLLLLLCFKNNQGSVSTVTAQEMSDRTNFSWFRVILISKRGLWESVHNTTVSQGRWGRCYVSYCMWLSWCLCWRCLLSLCFWMSVSCCFVHFSECTHWPVSSCSYKNRSMAHPYGMQL